MKQLLKAFASDDFGAKRALETARPPGSTLSSANATPRCSSAAPGPCVPDVPKLRIDSELPSS
jgi:hypothetical protein